MNIQIQSVNFSLDSTLKSFINNNMNYAVNQNIDDPKNKIVLIYNHA